MPTKSYANRDRIRKNVFETQRGAGIGGPFCRDALSIPEALEAVLERNRSAQEEGRTIRASSDSHFLLSFPGKRPRFSQGVRSKHTGGGFWMVRRYYQSMPQARKCFLQVMLCVSLMRRTKPLQGLYALEDLLSRLGSLVESLPCVTGVVQQVHFAIHGLICSFFRCPSF